MRFLVAQLKTGEVIGELPLTITSDCMRAIGTVGSAEFTLPVLHPACPEDWRDLLMPWWSLVIVVDDNGEIMWAGVPTGLKPTATAPLVPFPALTLEGYLARRYVPDMTFSGVEQTAIARALVEVCVGAVGLPFVFEVPTTGVRRDRTYHVDESARVFDRLTELSQVRDGFEWTIDVRWTDGDRTAVKYVFRIGYPCIGTVTEMPAWAFELPGSITQADVQSAWGDGEASTFAIAVGDGEGDSRTISNPVIDTVREGLGWPRLETQRSFSGVTDQYTIDAHARAVADETFGGKQVVTVIVRADAHPLFGEWSLGDSARLIVNTDSVEMDEVSRIVGWKVSGALDTVAPILARMEA